MKILEYFQMLLKKISPFVNVCQCSVIAESVGDLWVLRLPGQLSLLFLFILLHL